MVSSNKMFYCTTHKWQTSHDMIKFKSYIFFVSSSIYFAINLFVSEAVQSEYTVTILAVKSNYDSLTSFKIELVKLVMSKSTSMAKLVIKLV